MAYRETYSNNYQNKRRTEQRQDNKITPKNVFKLNFIQDFLF